MLSYIKDKGKVTQAQIEGFVREGIAATVDGYYGQRGTFGITPTKVYAEWKQNGKARGIDGLQIVKGTLTNFYLTPTKEYFAAICGINSSYNEMDQKGDAFAYAAGNAFYNVVRELSDPLWYMMISDKRSASAAIAAAGQAGKDFFIFSINDPSVIK
jgi:hypothetical protein